MYEVVQKHELLIKFVLVMSKEPEAVIISTAETFSKIASFLEMAKCLSTIYIFWGMCVSPDGFFALPLECT